MRYYLILDQKITVFSTNPGTVTDSAIIVRAVKDFDQRRFPVSRLAALWNALPNIEPVASFRSRDTALKRLWSVLEALPLASARTDSKQARLIGLLRRPSGASMDQLMAATGWQRHSVRGVLSGVIRKKLGHKLGANLVGDRRIYRISA